MCYIALEDMAQPSWPQPLMKKRVDGETCMDTLWIQQDTSSKVLRPVWAAVASLWER